MEALLRAGKRGRDPFGGRRDHSRPARVILQVADGLPLYWALGPREMAGAAAALARCWQQLGIGPGDRVAIYDYGTSPLALFASASYLAYLRAGAADLIGCIPICNDGLPELAPRAVHILKYVQPKVMFVQAEAMEPLLAAQARAGDPAGPPCTLVAAADEQTASPSQLQRWARRVGRPVRQLLRSDAALFFAAPCPSRSAYHASGAHYLLEALSEGDRQPLPPGEVGLLTITNLFLRTCPVIRYVTDLRAALMAGPCPCGESDYTILSPP
jgi:phenylacetate-CoA ligase